MAARRRNSDCNISASPTTAAARSRRAAWMRRVARAGRDDPQAQPGVRKLRLFAGVECDILRDGSLDFPDEVLAELDYVVASVHSAFTLSEADMTRRIVRAIQNPYVTMLAHPTGDCF